jgi:hypothetical protein
MDVISRFDVRLMKNLATGSHLMRSHSHAGVIAVEVEGLWPVAAPKRRAEGVRRDILWVDDFKA